jgi:hypothetical protein
LPVPLLLLPPLPLPLPLPLVVAMLLLLLLLPLLPLLAAAWRRAAWQCPAAGGTARGGSCSSPCR